jgi:ubiquinone biosynthesis protein
LRHLAELAERHLEAWRSFRLVATVDELARTLQKELDFGREAAHLDRFAWQFREETTLYLPRVYPDLTTTQVLVMEYVPGIKASCLTELSAAGVDLAETARRIADLVMKQMFVHGFFHADPHPGNIHIMADQRVCFLDFGMMGFLDRRTREAFADLAWGIAERNQRTTAAALLRLTAAEAEPEHHAFESDVADFMHQHFYKSAGEIQFSQLVGDLLQLTRLHGLLLPPDLVVMFKALGQTEELVRRLNPSHDLVAQAAPFIRDVRLERLRPRRLWDEWSTVGRDAAELVRDLPAELRRLLSQFKRGQGRLHFYHEGLEPALQTLDRVSNRLAFAAVLAALVIGSSIIVHARVPPVWNGVSVLGLAGYVCAGFMGFWLLLAILRHGRM